MFALELERRIEKAYQDRGYARGWRLLASPIHVLVSSDVAFIGLNPGGSLIDPTHAVLAPLNSSAYLSESWAGHPAGCSPLQLQVRMLFEALHVEPTQVLAGNLVPFRSQSWVDLAHRQWAIAFGKAIWADIFAASRPKLVVTMGTITHKAIADLLGMVAFERLQVGWGTVNLSHADRNGIKLVGLPHLSRFAIIGRQQSQSALEAAFGPFWKT